VVPLDLLLFFGLGGEEEVEHVRRDKAEPAVVVL
jgi:hypothetical protein